MTFGQVVGYFLGVTQRRFNVMEMNTLLAISIVLLADGTWLNMRLSKHNYYVALPLMI